MRAIEADEAIQYPGLVGDIPSYILFNASASYKPQGTSAMIFISGINLNDNGYLAGRERQIFSGIRYDF